MSIASTYQTLIDNKQLTPDPAQADVIALFTQLEEQLKNHHAQTNWLRSGLFGVTRHPAKGLYLWGGVGRGKSMLMDLFYQNLPLEKKRRVHFHAFMQDIHSAMNKIRKDGVKDPLRLVVQDLVKQLDLLCFDEMQITDITDAMLVGRLFEILCDHGVIVVITSNRSPDDLYKDGLNRHLFLPFIALLKERLIVHEIGAQTDYRQNRLIAQQRYFTPRNATNQSKFDQLWLGIAGDTAKPRDLTHQGRKLHLALTGNGAAQVSFADLCDKALGAADYLLLTQEFHTLFLRDIPILDQSQNNQAKRFTILIDTVYESKTQLIALAAAPPDALYQRGRGAFEFERTASRLHEMMSADWITN